MPMKSGIRGSVRRSGSDVAVEGRLRDSDQVADLPDGVLAAIVEAESHVNLGLCQLLGSSAFATPRPCRCQSRYGTFPNEVALELR